MQHTSHIKMDTYHAQLESAESVTRMMKLGCYLFMAVVGLIGFMNAMETKIKIVKEKIEIDANERAVNENSQRLHSSLL